MQKIGLELVIWVSCKMSYQGVIVDSYMINSVEISIIKILYYMAAYFGIKTYCIYTTNLFFREIEVINPDNVPSEGPTIVYGNHNNQFVDGMLLCAEVKREINFVAAAASLRRRIIGDLLKISGAIPLERAQDLAKKGVGTIAKIENGKIYGNGTKFTTIKPKSLLKIKKQQIRVDEIISDEEIKTTQTDIQPIQPNSQFKVIPKMEYYELYHHVWDAMNHNKCIGIFPQGGSHDRLGLLPLKAGICIMALGAMDAHPGCQVTLVPAGFNYYNPQNFRSKVIIEFGPPYKVPQELVDLYRQDKKKAISTLLETIQKMLKSVTIQCLTFDQLSTLFLCRDLYAKKTNKHITSKEKLELNRRFAKGFDQLVKEPKFRETYEQLKKFNDFVKLNGLSLMTKKSHSRIMDIIKFVIYFEKCVLRLCIALPGIILMGPTTSLIAYQAQKERLRCLKNSDVKVRGNDVVGSYKILLSMIYFPITTGIHTVILYKCLRKFTELPQNKCMKICLLIPLLMPLYALLLVKSYDSLGRSWTKLKYLLLRIFKRSIYTKFEQKKKQLGNKIVKLVDQYGQQVVEDFDTNRIIKPEDINESFSRQFIESQ